MFNEVLGCVYINFIVDVNLVVGDLQILGMVGRDLMNFEVLEVGGVEYIFVGGSIYVSEDIVKLFYVGNYLKIMIQVSGYVIWYLVLDVVVGKCMMVNLLLYGVFVVYNQVGCCINYLVVSGINEVIFLENGRVVFVGDLDL